MKIKDHSNGKYQVHLYADGNLVVRRNSDETVVGSVGTTEARTTGPTAPPPDTVPSDNWTYNESVSDAENIRRAYIGYLGREPSDQEIAAYLANSVDVASDIQDIATSPEATRYRAKPPEPAPIEHPNPIRGLLRSVNVMSDGAHFADDFRELLPIGLTWFGALDQRRSDPQGYRRTLSAIVDAGYQYARVLFAVAGGDGYWDGHEVTPHDCTTTDGVSVRGWDDYNAQVIGLGQDFAAAGLQLFVSSGGLQSVFAGDLERTADWATRLGGLLDESGVQVAFVEGCNEAWQNWVTGSEPSPDEVNRYVVRPFFDGYLSRAAIGLRSAPPEGETCEGFNRWAGDIIQKHGHRGHYPQDHTSAVRHSRGIFYSERGGVQIPDRRLGIESEPVGPGASVNTLDGEEALALLCAANFVGGFAYVYHSARGVRWWDGPIDKQPGFLSSPHVASYLPRDLMSAYTTILHGGLSESPLTDADGFPDENRVDSVVTSDGKRFVTLVYGQNGYTRLRARVPVRFSIMTPDTGEAHRFTLRPGETLDIDYTAGRVLVGEVL